MTPPPTQNLKALGLWVFFLIYSSIFSFVPNVGFRLRLEYLTISLSSVSSFSTLIHSPLSGSILNPSTLLMTPLNPSTTPHLYRCSHTYTGHACPEDFRYRVKHNPSILLMTPLNPQPEYITHDLSQPEYVTHDPSLVPQFTHLYGTHLPGRLLIQSQTPHLT